MTGETDALLPGDPCRGARALPQADPDAELMIRFQQGDRECFDLLFQKYKGPVLRFAARLTGRREVAEELAQDILVKCYLGASSYQPAAKFSTWLFRIARNHCLNELRRPDYRHRQQPLAEATEPGGGDSPEAALQGQAVQRAALAALASLPEAQRTALLLSRSEGMCYEEIAATMQTSVSAVKSLLNRAKRTLQDRLAGVTEKIHEM